jgi:flagellar M-ring protein FliF
MPEFLSKTTKQLNEFWNGMEKPKRTKLIVLVSLLLILAVSLVFLLNRKEYVTLYSGLNSADAGEILGKLEEMNIQAKPVGNDTILVLKEQEPGVRMQLSAQGYPKSGFNYDLFMNGVGFGTTDYEKRKYLQFQLQDRLQDAIRTLNGVSNAIVTLSIPEEDSFVFQADRQPASASVVLELEQGYEITPKQVKGIEELVSKSILGLKPEDISIIDSSMNLLNPQNDSDSELAGSQLELENQVRGRLEKQVISLLEPVFGYKKVLAAVNVRLNFDKQVTETTRFEPVTGDEGIVVSMSELKEEVKNADGTGGVPGQDSNGDIPEYPAAADGDSDYKKVSNTVNYELNQIKEQLESAQGQIKDLSVSVVIDSADLTPEIKTRVQDIVAGAAGIGTDKIIVENMRFQNGDGLKEQIQEEMNQQSSANTLSLIKSLLLYGLIALFALVVIFLIYRLFMENTRANRMTAAVSIMETAAAAEPGYQPIDLEVAQSSTYKEVTKLVKQRPEEAAQLLRTWLNEDK